jgi:hypothetical protein
MKRREFLKTPAVGMVIPSAMSADLLFPPSDPEQTEQKKLMIPAALPQRLHQDFETYVQGIEYFPLGNGDIQAVVQYSPDRSGSTPQSFYGLTIMDAEKFSRKWSTYLFHPEVGFGRTMLGVTADGKRSVPTPDTLKSIGWKLVENVPVVSVVWTAGAIEVEEEIFLPSEGPMLFRVARLKNASGAPVKVRTDIMLVANFALFDEIYVDDKEGTALAHGLAEMKLQCLEAGVETAGRYELRSAEQVIPAGQTRTVRFVYRIRSIDGLVSSRQMDDLWKKTVLYWKSKQPVVSGNETFDHLYAVSRNGLKAQLARSGKRDAGYWMYNMQWARDDSMMAIGMVQAGFIDEAKSIMTKILDKFIGVDGRTIEASRWAGFDYTELDQNGAILYAMWQYWCWTGDTAFIRKYWSKMRLAGDFPLMDVFRDPVSHLMRNKREFWERNDTFGVEDGFEIAYQFWVSLGLEKGSELARLIGDTATASRWTKASAEIKDTVLNDPRFRLIEEGHFIKRRTRDGRWQKFMIPTHRASMPPGSPLATEERPEAEPDTANVYPIIYEWVDPKGDVSRKTLDHMETLWNQRWTYGGYSRYNTASEPDPGGPWPFASLFVARAAVEAGDSARAWRVLDWLATIHGGKSGAWFERYGPSITPPAPPVSIVGWAWGEMVMLAVQHVLGVRPETNQLVLRPKLIEKLDKIEGTFNIRGSEFNIIVRKTGGKPKATVNGKEVALEGRLALPYPKKGSKVKVEMEV